MAVHCQRPSTTLPSGQRCLRCMIIQHQRQPHIPCKSQPLLRTQLGSKAIHPLLVIHRCLHQTPQDSRIANSHPRCCPCRAPQSNKVVLSHSDGSCRATRVSREAHSHSAIHCSRRCQATQVARSHLSMHSCHPFQARVVNQILYGLLLTQVSREASSCLPVHNCHPFQTRVVKQRL